MIPNLTGMDDRQKIEVLAKAFNALEKKKVPELPKGTCVLRYGHRDNAGFGYGTWTEIDDRVVTSQSTLSIYVRTE